MLISGIHRDVLVHKRYASAFLVVFSGRFINYLAEAAIGDISPAILSRHAVQLPVFLSSFSARIFLGILLSFGRLYAESEMTSFEPAALVQASSQ